jgi:hypothetical protein
MADRRPAYNIRISLRDGSEQSFTTFSGKSVTSKWRNAGAAWSGKFEETPFNLTFEKGTKLVLADGTEFTLDDCYLDLRVPYDPDRKPGGGKPAGKPAAKKPETKKRAAPPADPFA